MSEDRNEEWELSKENIRPIQQGRKTKVLKVALASHTEDVIVQQRQSYENELRTYSGDDSLAVWCKYIKWVEQNFPKGGREGHIKQLIERCLSILKDENKYYDDDRFVDIMLKYAILCGKPIDVYDYMFSNNIGCRSTKFFINWSWELEQLGNLKKADEILNEGIQRRAKSLEEMHSYYKDFQIRLTCKIKAASEEKCFESENSRSAFSVLKPHKKILAPISRTGEAVIENRKMPLILRREQPQPKAINSSVKLPFKIHDSENVNPSLPVQLQSGVPSDLNSENYKENEQRPSKWSKVRMKPHDQYFKTPNTVKPAFKFHCDDENVQEIHTPRSVPKISKILSTRSKTSSPPMALFEPPDPLRKPMYPKSKVYGGAEEFSLEEIRAAEWFDKRKKIEQEMLLIEQQKKIEEQKKTEEELKIQVEYLAKRVELLQNNVISSVPESCTGPEPLDFNSESNTLENVKTEINRSNMKLEAKKIICENFENSLINVHSHMQNGTDSHSMHESNVLSPKNISSTNSNLHDSFEDKGTDLVGLCNAAEMVQELYNRTLSHSINDGECKQNLNKELGEECFAIPLSSVSNLNEANWHEKIQNSILKESNDNLPFTFYHDPTGMIANSNDIVCSKESLNKEEGLFLSPNEACFEEDVENIPPKGYVQDTTKRELAGILEPSTNIAFIPLEEQEDTDDISDEEDYIYLNERKYSDDTLIPPSNTEQFSAAKFLSSTPYTSRNNSPILENLDHQIAPSEANNLLINEYIKTESPNSNRREFENDQDTHRTELKSVVEQSCLPKMLSVIMETSSETYSKSSSSSSASLTKSNNIGSLSSHRISMFKQCSKSETCEPSTLNCVLEVSDGISDSNCQDSSVISHKDLSEKDQKFQLYTVDFDPFDQKRNYKLLSSVNSDYKDLYNIDKSVGVFKSGDNIIIGNKSYRIISLVAEGAYAKVYEAVDCAFFMFGNSKKIALKVCKNSDEWEFYICRELQKRLSEKELLPDIKNSVMNVISVGKYLNGIILVSDYGNLGTLLDIINFCKTQNSAMPELIVMYFTLEILFIVSKLHECNIIHGDIKPDNFLLTNNAFDISSVENLSNITKSLQLIDFGRAIDLNFYDKGICFTSIFSTAYFKCNEMKDKKPWVFQLDWYGVASCIHTMLFSDYMVVRKKNDVWGIEKKLKRYWCTSLWDSLFNNLLNIPECYQEPDLKSCISVLESKLQQNSVNFINQFMRFSRSYATGK